ncbi:MAG TPA: DHH family phosphoesterase [Clostridiales bacterium]|nr:DHH family phosphoesterase [Clostridiales bacterium]
MKKKMWTVTPYFLVFTVAILGMAAFSVRWNMYIFAVEMMIAGVSILIVYLGLRRFQRYVNSVVSKAINGVDGVNHDYLERFSIPVVVAGSAGDVVWFNTMFRNQLCNGRDSTGDFVKQYIPNTTLNYILSGNGADVIYGDKRYTVLGSNVGTVAILYFIDDTYYKETAEEYVKSRPAVATVVFDNYAEFEHDMDDEQNAYIQVSVENAIQKWAVKNNALFKKMSGGKYLVILEEREIEHLIDEKFSILQEIRELKLASTQREPTISIGVGRGGKSFKQSDLWSRNALEMALGRGGDQVAIKTKEAYQFFGGVSRTIEKIDKVRTRVIASSLSEHIKASDHVLIMGHKNSDLDCVGAAIGLWSTITKSLNIPSHVVVRKNQTLASQLINSMNDDGCGNMFIEPQEALSIFTEKTLLIIVDTHSPSFLEEPKLYERSQKVVVIDHHRMMVNHISNALVFFHEPYASSTAEMATELIQYMGDDGLTRSEAEALLSGITLDTKNFVLKTGVRTFEAAAYLRKKGADTVEVKRLFSNSLDTYKSKYHLVSQAEIFNNCALACADEKIDDIRVTAAQAADELLSINSVQASFVIFKDEGIINISARSMGEINVQLMMEELGGGGHQTMAGVQLPNITMEQARESVVDLIEKTVGTVTQAPSK